MFARFADSSKRPKGSPRSREASQRLADGLSGRVVPNLRRSPQKLAPRDAESISHATGLLQSLTLVTFGPGALSVCPQNSVKFCKQSAKFREIPRNSRKILPKIRNKSAKFRKIPQNFRNNSANIQKH